MDNRSISDVLKEFEQSTRPTSTDVVTPLVETPTDNLSNTGSMPICYLQ